jgi:hypothetical protein
VRICQWERPLERYGHRWENNIKMGLGEIPYEGAELIE